MESTRSGRSGQRALMFLINSRPLPPLREMSTTATSGFRTPTASKAFGASSASPHTIMSVSWLISSARPLRRIGWSSMSKTRCFAFREAGAGASGRLPVERLFAILLRLIRFILITERAGDAGAAFVPGSDYEFATDAARAKLHDTKAQTFQLRLG